METHFKFEELVVYQKSLEIIDRIHEIAVKFPRIEIYSLSSQFRRASNSIALNIAEGSGGTKKEFAKFIRVAIRSLRESVVCTELAFRRKYIDLKVKSDIRLALAEISRMLSGLLKSLK